MKAQLLKVTTGPGQSFSVRQDHVPYVNNRWHYHSEIELIHFKKGEGTQFVGDSIRQFKQGDVVLVGSKLPHYWKFGDKYFDDTLGLQIDVRVAHFSENFWGDQFLELPENVNIRTVLEKAKLGLQINGPARQQVGALVNDMLQTSGSARIMLLMQALEVIASSKQLSVLSSMGFVSQCVESESDRINAIYDYTLKNFRERIDLEKIAQIANISPNSFCRYFKSRTRKTYSQFLIEVRVGHACKLLIENHLSIKQLCYESGFNNFTSFHKYFKLITGKSPLSYQREIMAA